MSAELGAWCRAAGGLWFRGNPPAWILARVEYVGRAMPIFRVRELVWHDGASALDTDKKRFLGCMERDAGRITVYAAGHESQEHLAVTVAHEVAHALFDHGLNHAVWTARLAALILRETDWRPCWRDRVACWILRLTTWARCLPRLGLPPTSRYALRRRTA